MVTSLLPTSFQLSSRAAEGVIGFSAGVPPCARTVPARASRARGARRKIERTSCFMVVLLLDCLAASPKDAPSLPSFPPQVQRHTPGPIRENSRTFGALLPLR